MAGHSKWAQIKRQKAVKDSKRGAAFARCSREIMMAAKLGGGDPAGNFRLRTAIDRAKAEGMPNDNITRAIAKGSGQGGADALESMTYEGYGPGGVAVFIEAMTDNKNRTAGDIRSYFNKCDGNLGADGCVAWIFKELGEVRVQEADALKLGLTEETLFEQALEAGATDFRYERDEGEFIVETAPVDLNTVCQALSGAGVKIASAEMTRQPQNSVAITETHLTEAKALLKLLDLLEAHDDVQAVYANVEMEAALVERILQERAAMP